MSTIQKVVDRAISKGWAPSSDKQAILTRINKLSQNYGFSPDDFGIAACTESYGLNPQADNGQGCVGIIQFCPNRNTPGVKTIKNKNYRLQQVKKLSLLKQLDLTDDYYSGIIAKSARSNMPGVRLYFYILLPVIAHDFESYDPNVDLKKVLAANPNYGPKVANLLNGQAPRFYVGQKRNAEITINSVKKALEVFAEKLLGEPVSFNSTSAPNSSNTISGIGGVGLDQPFGITTGIITGSCNNVFPLEFSLKEAITYKGCLGKITPTVMGGTSLSYPSQGMKLNGAGSVSLADYDPSVPIAPGSLGKPMSTPKMILVGNLGVYGAQRVLKSGKGYYWHSGQDYGTSDGSSFGKEILAVADGVIVNNKMVGGYNPGTIEMVCPQLGSLFIRYGHVIPSVKIGQEVKKGEVIGKIGKYALPSGKRLGGDHLHLELRKDKGKGFSAYSADQLKSETISPALYCKRK